MNKALEDTIAHIRDLPRVEPERVASAAANGVTLNAQFHRGNIPAGDFMLQAEQMMGSELGVGALSAYRRRVADTITNQESEGSTVLRDRELQFLDQHGDATSPTRWLFESALLETIGEQPSPEAMDAYKKALELCRIKGLNNIEQ